MLLLWLHRLHLVVNLAWKLLLSLLLLWSRFPLLKRVQNGLNLFLESINLVFFKPWWNTALWNLKICHHALQSSFVVLKLFGMIRLHGLLTFRLKFGTQFFYLWKIRLLQSV
eukprot:TRINITY_DN67760_c0_g1_i1.p2 TRINITY_DN67760_c0_g1~~TRINITY_DN67760_c0_g1_i1.p2  ORF type:complete len:112 (+),score=7.74 TRINITY_DN67760_c0_g1_i1:60-395(+)